MCELVRETLINVRANSQTLSYFTFILFIKNKTMKKSFPNFLLLTLIISILGVIALEGLEYLMGPVALFQGAVVTVILGFCYVVFMQIKTRKP